MLSAKQILIGLSIKHAGDWKAIYSDIQNKVTDVLDAYYELFEKSGYEAVTIIEENYPESLKTIAMPPFVLFYRGDFSLIKDQNKCISIIGTREPSEYGKQITETIAKDISKDLTIVSGMSNGVSKIAHEAALDNDSPTVAVLGSGVNYIYPAANEDLYNRIVEKGLVISEYFGDVGPTPERMQTRKRIIAAISAGTLITESKQRSGSELTAALALSFGRTVMACPSEAGKDSLCNALIKDGATLIERPDDVRVELKVYKHQKK